MAKEKAVKDEVEAKTTPEESAPSKDEVPQEVVKEESSQKTALEQDTPADASVGTEEEAKTVPYDRFKEVNDRNKFLEARAESQGQSEPLKPPISNLPPQELDPEAKVAVDAHLDYRNATEFIQKHEKELEDPVLAGTTQQVMRRANTEGKRINLEDALVQAKQILDDRVKPKASQAKKEGVEEGKEVTRKKEQAQAIGDVREHAEIDESKLSADEWAKHKGLKFVE